MRRTQTSVLSLLLISLFAFAFNCAAQDREKFVISARAGGVNAVTGRATLRAHGNAEWRQLTIKEDLEMGDAVRTGIDGRVEMLLNPGSYLRLGENSEFELTDNSLENLEVRLIRGTAIVEVTGADDTELLINIATPHARMAIVRRGLYRLNVVPGDATELIVRKGRVMLEPTHTKVKGGDKVVFSDNTFSVAKLKKTDKTVDSLEGWSKDRAQTLTRANSRISTRDISGFIASYRSDWWQWNFPGRSGVWLFDPLLGFYTFFPFAFGWGSPYGLTYGRSFYGTLYYQMPSYSPGYWPPAGSGSSGSGSGGGAGNGGGVGSAPTYNPTAARAVPESPAKATSPSPGAPSRPRMP